MTQNERRARSKVLRIRTKIKKERKKLYFNENQAPMQSLNSTL